MVLPQKENILKINNKKLPPLLVQSRHYWYRDVTVLLPGRVIWKQVWIVLSDS